MGSVRASAQLAYAEMETSAQLAANLPLTLSLVDNRVCKHLRRATTLFWAHA